MDSEKTFRALLDILIVELDVQAICRSFQFSSHISIAALLSHGIPFRHKLLFAKFSCSRFRVLSRNKFYTNIKCVMKWNQNNPCWFPIYVITFNYESIRYRVSRKNEKGRKINLRAAMWHFISFVFFFLRLHGILYTQVTLTLLLWMLKWKNME